MRSLISLEFRKQRKTFFGLLLIIAITLTLVTGSVSIYAVLPLGETFLSAAVMLEVFGIPFFALLLGGAAGAALRSPERKAEEDIPVSPFKRALAAYITSFVYLFVLAGLLLVASGPMQFSADVQNSFQVPLIMMLLLPLHSAAFVFSYWLAQGLLGSVVSLISTLAPGYWLYENLHVFSTSLDHFYSGITGTVALILLPFVLFGGTDFVLFAVQTLPELVATVGHLMILLWLVNRIERERKTWLPTKVAIAILLLSTLSLSIWGFFGTQVFINHQCSCCG